MSLVMSGGRPIHAKRTLRPLQLVTISYDRLKIVLYHFRWLSDSFSNSRESDRQPPANNISFETRRRGEIWKSRASTNRSSLSRLLNAAAAKFDQKFSVWKARNAFVSNGSRFLLVVFYFSSSLKVDTRPPTERTTRIQRRGKTGNARMRTLALFSYANERGNSQSVTTWNNAGLGLVIQPWRGALCNVRRETRNGTRVPRLNRFFVARWIKIQIEVKSMASTREANQTSTKPRSRSRILIWPHRFIRLETRFCKVRAFRLESARCSGFSNAIFLTTWTNVDTLFIGLFMSHCPLFPFIVLFIVTINDACFVLLFAFSIHVSHVDRGGNGTRQREKGK